MDFRELRFQFLSYALLHCAAPPKETNGYLRVRCNGGLNQQRSAVCIYHFIKYIMDYDCEIEINISLSRKREINACQYSYSTFFKKIPSELNEFIITKISFHQFDGFLFPYILIELIFCN